MVWGDGSGDELQTALALAARKTRSGEREQRNSLRKHAAHDWVRRYCKQTPAPCLALMSFNFSFRNQKIGANGTENLIDTMYSNRENLEAIFRMMDLDSNGLISIDEFKQACEMLSGELSR